MKRSARIVWWCSLIFTLFTVGSVFYPLCFSDESGGAVKNWGDWNNLVGLEVPSGEVKRFDMYGHFDGGCGTTWFLCRVDEDWLQGCIHRFGLETTGHIPAVMDDESLERWGAFRKWEKNPNISCWTKMIGGPFLWKDGMQPSRKEDEFHYRVSLFFSPDRKEAILGLDRDFSQKGQEALPLDIAEGGGSWMTAVKKNVPGIFIAAFCFVALGLCVLAPCLLVWLPVWARVRKAPEKTGKGLKFWYYAGTVAASLLLFSCCMLAMSLESSVSGVFTLFLIVLGVVTAPMLIIAQVCLPLEKKKDAVPAEVSFPPSAE